MDDNAIQSFLASVQTNHGVTLAMTAILALSAGCYFVYSYACIRKNLDVTESSLKNYQKFSDELVKHFEKQKTLSRTKFEKIYKNHLK